MNREEVIKLAREQGLPETETEGVFIQHYRITVTPWQEEGK